MASGKSPKRRPAATRAVSSSARLEVVAASTEPSRTTLSTPSITGRRPYRSPSRPSIGVKTAAASRLAVTTQLAALVVTPRSAWMLATTGTTRVCSAETSSTA